jgi:hypothetical protein
MVSKGVDEALAECKGIAKGAGISLQAKKAWSQSLQGDKAIINGSMCCGA